MELYVLRHAIAEPRRPGHPDAGRKLLPEGEEKLRSVLERARAAKVKPAVILTSPYTRAVQTAEIAAKVLGTDGEIVRTDALLPGSSPQAVWAELRTLTGDDPVLIAGHEPMLSQTISYLLGTSSVVVDFKKAALARIDMDRTTAEPHGLLQWLLTPKLAI